MLIINPGSGPVADADEVEAARNMDALAADVREAGAEVGACVRHAMRDAGDGRYSFELLVNGRARCVDMPGLPLDGVRYVDGPDQNIWDFPRLYVDGDSWVWTYAVSVLADSTRGES